MTQGEVRELFDYRDGQLFWKKRIAQKTIVGSLAGYLRKDGYRVVFIRRKHNYIHRLIWIWHNGAIPDTLRVDHKDMDPTNNRIDNLRLLTHAQNLVNAGVQRNNTSGYRGVSWNKRARRWRADHRQKGLGLFATKEQASAAYEAAARKFIGAE